MEKWQREAIRKNYVDLVNNLDQTDQVIDILYNERCLADSTRNALHAEKSEQEKNRKLLEHIQKKPAFEKFVNTLALTENGHLARKLVSGTPCEQMRNPLDMTENSAIGKVSSFGKVSSIGEVSSGTYNVRALPTPLRGGHAGIGPDLEKSPIQAGADGDSVLAQAKTFPTPSSETQTYKFPECWPDKERISEDIFVRPVTSENVIDIFKKQIAGMPDLNNYSMTSIPRGRAVIISNDVFADKTWNRPGNHVDEDRLVKLLQLLQFVVEVWKNRNQGDLRVLLDKEANEGSSSYSCFMMFILTHGRQSEIMTAENDFMQFEDILNYFDAGRSYRFSGKPKMFFIQACQGTERDNGSMPQRLADITERFANIEVTEPDSGLLPTARLPTYSDMLVAVATVPGFVSWRNTLHGSWFIQAIIEIFSNCACYEDVDGMMTMVNNLVSMGTTQGKQHVQISNIIRKTLRAKVYLFPGLPLRAKVYLFPGLYR